MGFETIKTTDLRTVMPVSLTSTFRMTTKTQTLDFVYVTDDVIDVDVSTRDVSTLRPRRAYNVCTWSQCTRAYTVTTELCENHHKLLDQVSQSS